MVHYKEIPTVFGSPMYSSPFGLRKGKKREMKGRTISKSSLGISFLLNHVALLTMLEYLELGKLLRRTKSLI